VLLNNNSLTEVGIHLLINYQWRRGLKKLGGAGSCNFPTKEIMGAQNFKFATKVSQNGGFSAQNFAFLDENFPTRRRLYDNFYDSPKFRGGGQLPPFLPLCDDATDNHR